MNLGSGSIAPPLRRLRPLDVGSLIDETLILYRQHFPLFAGIVAVVAIPEAALLSLAGGLSSVSLFFVGSLLALPFGTVITGALATAISQIYSGEQPSFGRTYKTLGWRGIVRLAGAGIFYLLLVSLGSFIAFIPSLVFLVWFVFLGEVIALEHRGAWDSLERSRALVTGSFWRVLGYRLLTFVIVLIVTGVVTGLGGLLLGALGAGRIAFTLLSTLSTILIGPVEYAALILLYFDLRIRKEGYDLEQLTRLLGSDAAI